MLQILVLKKYCGKNISLNKIQETRVKKISKNSVKNISVCFCLKLFTLCLRIFVFLSITFDIKFGYMTF